MITAIRSLRRSIDSLIEVVETEKRKNIPADQLKARVDETFLSWANLRPRLEQAGADITTVEPVDKLFTNLVRFTGNLTPKRTYKAQLSAIREILGGRLDEFGIRMSMLPQANAPAARLIPEISDLPSELVPRSLLGWIPGIREFLSKSPFENNAFIMVAYRKKLQPLISAVAECLKKQGLNPVIARDHRLTDDLNNPIACLLCCRYGIAIFDKGEAGQKHNSNVVYELAVMQFLKRPCALMKHQDLPNMPSDFNHRLYEAYKTKQDAVEKVDAWLRDHLPSLASEAPNSSEAHKPTSRKQGRARRN